MHERHNDLSAMIHSRRASLLHVNRGRTDQGKGRSVRISFRSLVALGILLAPVGAHAALIDLHDVTRRTGYAASIQNELLRYDAASRLMTYSTASRFDYRQHSGCDDPCVPVELTFDGLFVWGAGVDADGDVLNGGAMTWLGNLGHGFEVLATGSLAQIGTAMSGVLPGPDGPVYNSLDLEFLFDLSFLDPRVSGMGDQILLLVEQKLERLTPEPFAQSFQCPSSNPPGVYPTCGRWSTSGLVGMVGVSEPGVLGLLLMGLVGLMVFRARKVRRNGVSSLPAETR
jgi:hypothetical protein